MNQFKRGKSKIKIHAGMPDFYKFYKSNYSNPVDKKTYSNVIMSLNTEIAKAIIYDGFEFKMPGRLGFLSIIKKKHKLKLDENGKVDTRYLPVDFKKTKELWKKLYPNKTTEEILQIPDRKRVFYNNTHSSGFIYSWYYNKFTSNATNKSVYYFKPTRTNKRELASFVKSEEFTNPFFTY